MTKKEQAIVNDLATICTQLQSERTEFIYIAYALWKLGEGRIKDASRGVEDIFNDFKIAH